MKKLFLFCLIAAAAAFVSCSKDEEKGGSKQASIIGTWEIYKATVEYGHYTEVDNEWGEAYGYREIFEFRENGAGVNRSMENYNGRWETDTYPFTYSLDGNKLRFDGEEMTIEKLTATEMVWMEQDYYDGEYETYRTYLKRI